MTAYREQASSRTILFCPRDNELLDQLDFGVDICPRCEGFWIENSVLELSGRQWPAGPQAWWRNEVRCPACATQGLVTTMTARTSGNVLVDQCAAHGVWLDRGELARVMRDPTIAELTKLREHLAALEPTPVQLRARRERWEDEQEERARLAEIERKRIEAERAKRAAEEAKTEAQRAEERRQAQEATLREAERLAQARRDADQLAEAKRAEWQRRQAELRIEEDRAAIAEAERARQRANPAAAERELAIARQRVDDAERRVREQAAHTERERQRVVEARANARERVRWLEARIESLRFELATTEDKLVKARRDLQDAVKAVDEHRARTTIE